MPLIDNESQTMQQALINSLNGSDRVDIEVAFFYFSGWKLLANHLKDKKIRILVGKYIDPEAIPDLLSRVRQDGENVDLEPFQPRQRISSRVDQKNTYVNGFIRLGNESSLLDDSDTQEFYKILEQKIEDGSLEIKIANKPHHGKMYIVHKKQEFSEGGDLPGTVFIGSSNFTFQGLINQGELNRRDNNKTEYLESVKSFEEHWEDSENIDIAIKENKQDFVNKLKNDLWIHNIPSPYSIYIRVLHELFDRQDVDKIKTPSQITKEQYIDLEYQLDAIRIVMDKIEKYDGVILADVVGLGKSIIASAVANNLGLKTVIIAPPHLREQWDDYQEEFRLPGARIFSSGELEKVYNKYKENNEPLLFIIDEAHRYRNEDTYDYRMLSHACSSHPDNKVLLLTATPFNNNPKDVFALIKLFQIPGQSTIKSVDNLSLRFRELIERYRKLNIYRREEDADPGHIELEANEISKELRRLIENVVIRRSRLDLKQITRYREDLERQNIDFAKVAGPELLKYQLGDLLGLYLETLEQITGEEDKGGFIGARYKPTSYIKDEDRDKFIKLYGKDLDESDLRTAQSNLAKFMRRLLVMRFESSKEAFRSTLNNIINSTALVEKWWDELGKVPILKKGNLPDPSDIIETTNDEVSSELKSQTADDELEKLREAKGLISVDKSLISPQFIIDLKKDRQLLEGIKEKWFGNNPNVPEEFDPKLDAVYKKITVWLEEMPNRKIVIFSSYADTVNYLARELDKKGLKRILKYTAADSSKKMKETIRKNFDAGIKEAEQENDFDVIIATDALSEGFNLHRAGVVINYDIPYNPTRVIQRIGRINRINKKVFDELFIYNCFPTDTGESEIRIKQIATLKMKLINAVVGSDTQTLTTDENLQSFFKDEYYKAESETEIESWDAKHMEAFDQALKDKDIIDAALKIKPRSRVIRVKQSNRASVAFGKKGEHAIFALKDEGEPYIVAAEIALKYFKADENEQGREADRDYDEMFKIIRDTLFAKHPLPQIKGRRSDSLKIIKILETKIPQAKDYCRDLEQIIRKYDGINDGDLKRIAQLSLKDLDSVLSQLKEIVPEHQIASINRRASQLEAEYETIVLSEELRV